MQVQVDFWELLLALAGLISAFATVVWVFGTALVRQFEKRLAEKFATIEEARKTASGGLQSQLSQIQDMERDLLRFKAELPVQYVRREDYIRGQSVIEAKLDALYSKLETVLIQGAQR
jgi:hypothetical protein